MSIDAPSISRHHARIIVAAEGVSIEDLGSKNGTSVRGRRIRAIGQLCDGDTLLFGTIAATDHDDAAYRLVSKLLKGEYGWFKGQLVEPVVPTPQQVEEAMARLA